MRPFPHLLLAATLTMSSTAYADPAPALAPLPSEVRLSEAEKEKLLEAAAVEKRALEVETADHSGPQVHGEVGFTVGAGGFRSAYGTAVVPLEGEGVAIISLESTDFGKRRYVEPWWR